MGNELMDVKCERHVKIANDVVGKIAAIAALEVEGVSAMGNNITTEIMGKVGMKNLMKNVKVEILNGQVNVELAITVDYGMNIPGLSQNVQTRVKQAIENMTSLEVGDVNVRIAGINLVKED
ncbi:MAG: Asp23/Gls24 family envelope stress response protein [Lachnospiraceae bacterium]|nr:Asp23/Gls24 family envelope stress response protein [Lachnospiraceae bacterium]